MATRSHRTARLALTSLVIGMLVTIAGTGAAGASSGCGEYSFGFEGTRLLNDGISDSAGPFTISMPAGTYDITLRSFDDHAAHPGQLEQTQEQWYFVLDSGYVSPVSTDIPEDVNTMVDTFTNVTIEEASAISVHHLGEGGINSVAPMCVGFTTVVVPDEPAPDVPVADDAVDEPIDSDHSSIDVVVPPSPSADEPETETPVVPVEVKRAVEVNGPTAAVQTPDVAPQLAITGPSAYTLALLLSALTFLLVGIVCVFEDRRRSLALVRNTDD